MCDCCDLFLCLCSILVNTVVYLSAVHATGSCSSLFWLQCCFFVVLPTEVDILLRNCC
ncbi:hypothetical protein NSE_0744 [Neorickettsia sennetsu str. Miyayama]|uniref:Uncharacterized protein n=1 Tax=Ehrlichia sennetsu (strain ATCC VR-367 / Miyayama) TaxID=222891 RepID=Q2GD26_EHRS3|nr:hypothetical protein NSE_0744 [Neorickettsia sennetsu str. Miyayama]